MYYPIIDKLKKIMDDITSVKEKESLIIEGTLTEQTKGTWVGNYADILYEAGKRPIYFKIIVPTGDIFLIPLVQINNSNAFTCFIPFGASYANVVMYKDNTFDISLA